MDNTFDFRFGTIESKKERLDKIFMYFTTKELQDIMKCAEKLKIENYCTRPAVDVLFDIAGKLSILEAEIVSPTFIMQKIRTYLESN